MEVRSPTAFIEVPILYREGRCRFLFSTGRVRARRVQCLCCIGGYRILAAMKHSVPMMAYRERLADIVRRFPDKVALSTKTPAGYVEIVYLELDRQVRLVGEALAGLGVQRGMRVSILAENRPEWLVAYLGIHLAGGTVVPLDAQISPAEWRNLLDDSESQFAFVSASLLPKLRPALEGSPLAGRLISFDPLPEDDPDVRSFPAMIAGEAPARVSDFPETSLEEVMVIIYTSGTTGKPKGVMLTQGNIVGEIVATMDAVYVDEKDTLLCLLPLQHVLASVINTLLPLYLGAQINFVDTLKRSEILEALEEGKISILATVPQFFYLFHRRIQEELARKPAIARLMFGRLLRLNRFCLKNLRLNLGRILFGKIHRIFGSRMRLFVSGASPFDPKVAQLFHDLGFTILQGYGLTETTGACTATRVENNVIGSVGPALPGMEIRIVVPNEEGIGEIAVRGPVVMKGYYKNPQATAEVMQDGWFLTGDLGRMDERGNLFVTGRKKEVIVLPSGKNIYPDELEAHYGQCPYIQEIGIVGVADPVGAEQGDRLHAVIVPDFDYLKDKKIANAREMIRDEVARWSNQLPKYKRLMSYQIQAEPLPRTTTRKIKRLELKRLIESGELRDAGAVAAAKAPSADDRALLRSTAGREVVACVRDTYRRDKPIVPDMNLELDLGFDSMERVELLASLEQRLGILLPEGFGAEVFTVRDLVLRLQAHVGAATGTEEISRQSWSAILSGEALAGAGDWKVRFSGGAMTAFKYLMARLAFLLCRLLFRLRSFGVENLPARGAFLLCPNHLSYLDPFMVVCSLPYRVFKRTFFLGYSAFFEGSLMRFISRLGNIVPVDPDAHLLNAMRVGAWGLRQGRILCIFPEGARSFDGELQEFKKGAAILAAEVGVPIVPVAIRGTYEAWPRDSRRIRFHRITVRFGTPLDATSASEGDTYQPDTDRLKQAVAGLLQSHPM
ncbi:MAG: AMP-binding protein [Acidobacteria bacterium]|nr:AMP-binding protein [Acidobacteriota bacterium]